MNEEKAYWTHEIAKILDVSNSTLRKWCMELEKQGYSFIKSENGSRAYLVRDRELLLALKQHLRTGTRTVENAVQTILYELSSNDQRTPSKHLERGAFEQEFKKLNERLDQQEEFNKKMLEWMEERDRNLMMVLNEIQEQRKQIASTQQENKKWWKFWE